jgi:single-strand DNA-binding protein
MRANSVLLIGYVGQHLVSKEYKNGTKRVYIRMATHYKHTNEKGEKIKHTIWHNVVAWKSTAEFAERSFVKGSKIMVEGSINYRTYIDSEGKSIMRTQINAHNLTNLDR